MVKSMTEVVTLSVRMPKKDLEAFENAVRESGRFLNRSDALRFLIREFVETNKKVVI
ncbi:MAG: ribbon-helix-helix domain-containing protein [Archaeoglobaceae archaeon]|nr:ribbon-helix-helix domain-containing protein [Archaeoglobaceae archaeon]